MNWEEEYMNTGRTSTKKWKNKHSNRSHGAEKHNNGSEKYTKRAQKHTKWRRIKDQLTQRQDSRIHPIKSSKKGKEWKKMKIA